MYFSLSSVCARTWTDLRPCALVRTHVVLECGSISLVMCAHALMCVCVRACGVHMRMDAYARVARCVSINLNLLPQTLKSKLMLRQPGHDTPSFAGNHFSVILHAKKNENV